MDFMYVRKDTFAQVIDNYAILEKDKVLKAINLDKIKLYAKTDRIEADSIVTCCVKDESIVPWGKNLYGDGYEEGLTFKVSYIVSASSCYIAFGGIDGNGVHIENLRLATNEERESFLEDVRLGFIPEYAREEDDYCDDDDEYYDDDEF